MTWNRLYLINGWLHCEKIIIERFFTNSHLLQQGVCRQLASAQIALVAVATISAYFVVAVVVKIAAVFVVQLLAVVVVAASAVAAASVVVDADVAKVRTAAKKIK